MKQIWILALATCMLTACGSNDDDLAKVYLDAAEQAFAAGNYNEAKLQIDSIKAVYPKAFKTRKLAVRLMQKVELEEQQVGLVYLDSLMQTKQAEFEAMKGNFVLEKDAEYQEVGNYFAPSQTVEKNLTRSYLRAQVSELGEMTMTSVYYGSYNIHHTAVRVSCGDTFAETPNAEESYESTNLDQKIEKADFPLGKDGDVIPYIVMNKASTIRVELKGERSYKMVMNDADKKAFADIYALAQTLSSIEEIKANQLEAQRKIAFIENKMKEAEEKDAAEQQ